MKKGLVVQFGLMLSSANALEQRVKAKMRKNCQGCIQREHPEIEGHAL